MKYRLISSIVDKEPNKPESKHGDLNCNDPIIATPPSQRNRPGNKDLPDKPVCQHEQTLQKGQSAEGVSDPVTDPPSQASRRIITKPSRKPDALNKKTDPPIHAALKKSSTLSANDGTQICIDITGDQEAIEQVGLISSKNNNTKAQPQ